MRNKLFFFGGYQGTTVRQDPTDMREFVPTAAMLAGDFTAFASPACNANGRSRCALLLSTTASIRRCSVRRGESRRTSSEDERSLRGIHLWPEER